MHPLQIGRVPIDRDMDSIRQDIVCDISIRLSRNQHQIANVSRSCDKCLGTAHFDVPGRTVDSGTQELGAGWELGVGWEVLLVESYAQDAVGFDGVLPDEGSEFAGEVGKEGEAIGGGSGGGGHVEEFLKAL